MRVTWSKVVETPSGLTAIMRLNAADAGILTWLTARCDLSTSLQGGGKTEGIRAGPGTKAAAHCMDALVGSNIRRWIDGDFAPGMAIAGQLSSWPFLRGGRRYSRSGRWRRHGRFPFLNPRNDKENPLDRGLRATFSVDVGDITGVVWRDVIEIGGRRIPFAKRAQTSSKTRRGTPRACSTHSGKANTTKADPNRNVCSGNNAANDTPTGDPHPVPVAMYCRPRTA